ncbi:hypothetical protein KG088_14320 [Halomonas sp. TRM85114]|uniref:DUF6957 family protein n=1 Tax=Halomonas jincaotanensis TaxID=2810616 RepID=UPI001BD4C81C|nr:hypothetical protein [Halomonas jincaotanensis]MBS9404810.1 hypothetical protein [Halomonas jincaotanensis]
MILSEEDRKNEEEALRERYRNKFHPDVVEAFIKQLCEYRVVHANPTWAVAEEGIEKKACIVRDWEIINVVDAGEFMQILFSDYVVSDYKARFMPGEYVSTSKISHFDEDTGLVKTANSLYCLSGNGEEVNATLREAYNVRTLGQSLHVLRNVEGQLGPDASFRPSDE